MRRRDEPTIREKTIKHVSALQSTVDEKSNRQMQIVSDYRRFVPRSLVSQLSKYAEKWDVKKRTPCDVFWCASAFIDISGFSSLASELQSAEDAKKGIGRCKFISDCVLSFTPCMSNFAPLAGRRR